VWSNDEAKPWTKTMGTGVASMPDPISEADGREMLSASLAGTGRAPTTLGRSPDTLLAMCGRIALYTPPARLARFFSATLSASMDPEPAPSWNVGPTRDVLGVIDAAAAYHAPDTAAGRVIDEFRWGLIPSWAKDAAGASRLINARAETVGQRSSFRAAFEQRRLLVVADGFYEWRKGAAKGRPPYYFHRADGRPLAFAGLWEVWRDPRRPEDSPWLRTCTIITTRGGPDMAGIHDRMPVVLEPDVWDVWLDPDDHDLAALSGLLAPTVPGTLAHHRVDTRVGNVRNDDPGLIAPVAAQPTLAGLGDDAPVVDR